MALAQTVDDINTIPEAVRGAYVEKDGKFVLDFEVPDVAGLKATVVATRKERDAAAAQAKAWAALGKTPDEIAEMVAAADKVKEEAAKKAGNFDALLKQHAEKWGTERATLETRAVSAESFAKSAIVETSIMGALTKEKATTEGIDLLTERLSRRIDLQIVEGKRVVTIMQADGKTPMAGSGADGAATFDDLVKEAKKGYPSLFEGTGAGGGGKQPGSKDTGGSGDKTITRAELNALPVQEHAAKLKTHKLVD